MGLSILRWLALLPFVFALKARGSGVRDGPPRARAPDFPREAAEAKSAPPADASVGFLERLEGECETAVICDYCWLRRGGGCRCRLFFCVLGARCAGDSRGFL